MGALRARVYVVSLMMRLINMDYVLVEYSMLIAQYLILALNLEG
jgi:hypothetical protein